MNYHPRSAHKHRFNSFLATFGHGIFAAAPITFILVAICVVVYLLDLVLPLSNYGAFQMLAAYFQPWRFITAGFLHASIMHLVMNMLVLAMVGSEVERALGGWRYLVLYLLSVIGGSVGYVAWFSIDPRVVTIVSLGASGAGFGLFAAVFMLQRARGANLTSITVLLVVNLAFSFLVPGIAWQAHVGGLITGAIVAGLFAASAKMTFHKRQQLFNTYGAQIAHKRALSQRNLIDILGSVVILVALIAVSYVSYSYLLAMASSAV